MLNSIRARLTLWYTCSLALVLLAFAIAAYFFLAHAISRRTDNSLLEMARAFDHTVRAEELEIREGREQPPAGGWTSAPPEAAVHEAATEYNFRDYQILIYDERRKLAAASLGFVSEGYESGQPISAASSISNGLEKTFNTVSSQADLPVYTTLFDGDHRFRAVVQRLNVGDRSYELVVLRPLKEQEELLGRTFRSLLVGVPVALILASFGGYFLARKTLVPVVTMSETAAHISAENLSSRLPVANRHDELGQLALTFNQLLARLDQSFEQQRRFMADASHELRTAVSVVRGESEIALSQDGREADDLRESLAIVHDEGRRLTGIVEDLFTLARADAAGHHPLEVTNFYLEETMAGCVRAARALAAVKDLRLAYTPAREEMPFRGDEELIRRMLMNLLDNAIKYTPSGGSVSVGCETRNGEYLLTVRDTGNGIPSEMQSSIFERFYRVDKSRTRETESNGSSTGSGAGLGLAIARLAAEAHGGHLELTHSDATGSIFVASLPRHNLV
ncbi:MAG TPA: ATP-binding protein [Pyrinomonadaceae bacterium]|nr:ATP-binding protein [Pyrinomonadaceae bacterium]